VRVKGERREEGEGKKMGKREENSQLVESFCRLDDYFFSFFGVELAS
jgi:hypothetical protein